MNHQTSPRIALLGLGIMGEAIGERLLDRGFPLSVWNRTAEKGRALRRAARARRRHPRTRSPTRRSSRSVYATVGRRGRAFGRRGVVESLAARGRGGGFLDDRDRGRSTIRGALAKTASNA